MIEATLDRTLVTVARRTKQETQRLKEAVGTSGNGLPFGDFISYLVDQTGMAKPEVSEYFWELLDEGRISLTGDFRVEKR